MEVYYCKFMFDLVNASQYHDSKLPGDSGEVPNSKWSG